MATYYSDLFDGATNTVLDPQKRVNAGIGHGRLRYKRAEATGSVQNGDVLRLMQFHSSDRLHAVYMTHSAAGIGSTVLPDAFPAATTFAYSQAFGSGTDGWSGVYATLSNPGGYLHVAPVASPGWSGITKSFSSSFAGGDYPYVVMGMKDNADTGTWLGELNYTSTGDVGLSHATNNLTTTPAESDGYSTIYWDMTDDSRWMDNDVSAISGNGMVPWNVLSGGSDGDYDITAIYVASLPPMVGIINLGLYRSGRSHDGSEVDATLLLEGHDAEPAHAHLGHWEIPARLHGKHLWEIADAGTASYGADPDEEWDLCMNCTAGSATDSATYLVEAYFTTGD